MSSIEKTYPFDAEANPFISGHEILLPPMPFLAFGNSSVLAEAQRVGGWLKELAAVGSDVVIDNVLANTSYALDRLPEGMHDFRESAGDVLLELEIPNFENGQSTPRELIVGASALYLWEDPGF